MNYAKIVDCDLANGDGVRVSLFVSGCTHHCKGCFNKEAWSFDFGKTYTQETELKIISLLSKPYIKGITILGGEPFEPANKPALIGLLSHIKRKLPNKDVWCYTGFTIEQLTDSDDIKMMSMIDTLVDGEFVESLKDQSLKFRGSSNQRIIDVHNYRERSVNHGR